MKSFPRKALTSFYLQSRKVVLCAAGQALRPRGLKRPPVPSEIRKILFIRPDRLGDMVLSTPVLRAIKKGFPLARLTVLASQSNAPLLRYDPYVDEVVIWAQRRKRVAPIQFLRQAHRLAKEGYDVVIDPLPGNDLSTALIAYISGALLRIGFPGYGREVFFSRLAGFADGRHMVDLILETARLLGVPPDRRLPHIHLLPTEGERADRWLRQQYLGTRPLIGIHPGGYYPSQRWPAEYFARLAVVLKRDGVSDIVLLGGADDRELVHMIFDRAGEHLVLFQNDNLRESVALVSRLDLLVCNNSGPLHVAAALNVPTLSFMGPTEKHRWMPLGRNHKVLRREDLDCIGCNRGTCPRGDHACMRGIQPEEAANGIRQLLETAAQN
jgi:heptosyltransferase II